MKPESIPSQNKTNGQDGHSNEKVDDNLLILSEIKKNMERYKQLKMLQNPRISILEKIMIIETIEKEEIDSIYTSNICRGGLWDDWE
jgi:hypothetical protein